MQQVEPQTLDLEKTVSLASAHTHPGIHETAILHMDADEELADVAQHLLDNVLTQGRAADEKVRALFSTNSIFVAVIALGSSTTLQQLTGTSGVPQVTLGLALRGLLLLALAISTTASVLGLSPRLKTTEHDPSLFFFGNIAARGRKQFIRDFRKLSLNERTDQILSQVHVNSEILQVKYRWIRRSVTFLLIGVALWLAVLLDTYMH